MIWQEWGMVVLYLLGGFTMFNLQLYVGSGKLTYKEAAFFGIIWPIPAIFVYIVYPLHLLFFKKRGKNV